jgi:hypothetical protein
MGSLEEQRGEVRVRGADQAAVAPPREEVRSGGAGGHGARPRLRDDDDVGGRVVGDTDVRGAVAQQQLQERPAFVCLVAQGRRDTAVAINVVVAVVGRSLPPRRHVRGEVGVELR